MLTFYQKSGVEHGYSQVEIPRDSGSLLVYGRQITLAEAKQLAHNYQLPEHLLVEDLFDNNELPRIESTKDTKYIFVRNPEQKGNKIFSRPVLFIVKDDFFACISARRDLPNELLEPATDNRYETPYSLMINCLMAITKRYEHLIDTIGGKIDRLEGRIRSHEATNHDFIDFVTIESDLNRIKMSLNAQLAVATKLLELTKNKIDYEKADDIQLFIKQLLVETESCMQAIGSVNRAYGTVANNNLNQRMKILTALTLLLALPNVFYGMYGMNIQLPFMDEPWAYAAIVGFTVFLVISVYTIAKKIKLL